MFILAPFRLAHSVPPVMCGFAVTLAGNIGAICNRDVAGFRPAAIRPGHAAAVNALPSAIASARTDGTLSAREANNCKVHHDKLECHFSKPHPICRNSKFYRHRRSGRRRRQDSLRRISDPNGANLSPVGDHFPFGFRVS